jgi:rSAM/selenodomain-associated transferase 2
MLVSIVIPTLNEAERIAEVVRKTRCLGSCQIVVVDGGSSDGTLDRAAEADVCCSAPRGRANQLNAGAAAASGDVLLFLHADCWLEVGALEAVERVLSLPGVIAGCFRQRIGAERLAYRMLERGNTARVKMLGWAYGDQGLFLQRATFERLGPFPAIPFLEDFQFSKKLRRAGRIAVADAVMHVSPRRWQHRGIVRQTAMNWLIVGLAQLGVSPAHLARLYRSAREESCPTQRLESVEN